MHSIRLCALATLGILCSVITSVQAEPGKVAGDWPQWRYDAQRSAATPHELPTKMQRAWSRELPKLRPAWPDQAKMQLDATYHPIALGQRLYIGSSYDDSLTAYDTRTGEEAWRFFADAPIRNAPLAAHDKVYFASDDGYLYCLRASDGGLLWKFRGGPSDRKILGNERLISTWPARGAPVLADGKIYFAAGIWPFMGVFLHAVDAQTGEALWTNDGDGSMYIKQPHNTDSFAGVAPQGPLVVAGDKLLVPGGRSVPACFDRATGKFLYYQLAENGKKGGGSFVAAADTLFFNGGGIFDVKTEKHLGSIAEPFAFAEGSLFEAAGSTLKVHDLASAQVVVTETVDRKGVTSKWSKWQMQKLGEAEIPRFNAIIKAGSRLYGGGEGEISAIELPAADDREANVVWELDVPGSICELLAADDRLFAVTREGQLHCFAAATNDALKAIEHRLPSPSRSRDAVAQAKAAALLREIQVTDGYALAWGVGSGTLLKELVAQSSLRVIVIEANEQKAQQFRWELLSQGVAGDRLSVVVADPREINLPPYFASLIVAESLPVTAKLERARFLEKSFECLRPFGGVACLAMSAAEQEVCEDLVEERKLAGAEVDTEGQWLLVSREGPLPESANWTHEHADAANTRVSKDNRVKAPLGLLWFGGSTNDGILPRHGHGPQPQVVDGRLFIEGVDMLRAMDIYTGRVLWNATLPGVGHLYDNTAHQPGANASGTNYIATPDGIYVAYRDACLVLDPATGKPTGKFQLPVPAGNQPPLWGYLNVYEDYLIGGADPLFDPKLVTKGDPKKSDDDDAKKEVKKDDKTAASATSKPSAKDNDNYSASDRLVVMNRHTGKVLWTADARSGFRHNAICIGGGRLYCIDRLSGPQLSKLKRRGEDPQFPPQLVVFDLKTGNEVWSTEEDVFGTWLSYSAERDVLVEAGRTAGDTLSDEPKGMRAYRAKDGESLWTNKAYSGPAMLHHDTILMAGKGCNLLTGEIKMRNHPLSGELVEWSWTRNYGCNTPMASENLLTFRSGAAGYFDLCNDGGTGNFGGFRSSCTNNLVVAGGILTAPDYTRTCTCSYQNQTSLALVPMSDMEVWTSFSSQSSKKAVRQVGINLGAPGDRKADDGKLWLEYPSVGGSSPALDIAVTPAKPTWYRRHSSQISGDGLSWVASSGAEGLTSVKIKLGTAGDKPQTYTLRLHFAELADVDPGERVFSVNVQGKPKVVDLDVVQEVGGRNRALVKEIKGVTVGDFLLIELNPQATSKFPTMLSGIELDAEE